MTKRINMITTPHAYSLLYVACGGEDIRLYERDTSKELLRITVSNNECLSVYVSQDGKTILSGLSWNVLE